MKTVLEVYEEISKANPRWTAAEEREFVKKWWRKDREHFVNEALKHNLSLVFDLMHKVAFNPRSEDVFQKALSALVEALRKFKPKKNCKISTWVTNPVRWAIMQFQNPYNHQGSITDEIVSLNHRYGRKMSIVSIDSKIGGEDGDGDATLGDVISEKNVHSDWLFGVCKTTTRSEMEATEEIKASVAKMLAYMPKLLTKQELFVIKRMLVGKNMTEISIELKLSRMRISQITAKAFDKIRRCKMAKSLHALVKTDRGKTKKKKSGK